jgi:hypothetical protein
MGVWGYLPFENDDALDWLEELEAGGSDVIRQALAKAGDRYVEAPDGAVALAAAEVTAASQGNPLGDLPENVTDWVTAHGLEITAEDVEMAVEVVDRVRTQRWLEETIDSQELSSIAGTFRRKELAAK